MWRHGRPEPVRQPAPTRAASLSHFQHFQHSPAANCLMADSSPLFCFSTGFTQETFVAGCLGHHQRHQGERHDDISAAPQLAGHAAALLMTALIAACGVGYEDGVSSSTLDTVESAPQELRVDSPDAGGLAPSSDTNPSDSARQANIDLPPGLMSLPNEAMPQASIDPTVSAAATSNCPWGCYEANVACTGLIMWNTCWCPTNGMYCPNNWWAAGVCIGYWQLTCHY